MRDFRNLGSRPLPKVSYAPYVIGFSVTCYPHVSTRHYTAPKRNSVRRRSRWGVGKSFPLMHVMHAALLSHGYMLVASFMSILWGYRQRCRHHESSKA